MAGEEFEKVWKKIHAHEGEKFYTKTGLEFTYKIEGNAFFPSRTRYRIDKTDFEKVYEMLPMEGPGEIAKLVRGPSYVWAVLHDNRII